MLPRPSGPMFNEVTAPDGAFRDHYAALSAVYATLGPDAVAQRWVDANRQAALDSFSFRLDPRAYRPTPTDWVPRIVPADHWDVISRGVAQRQRALNRFLNELYCGHQTVVPDDIAFTSRYFYPEFQGFTPRHALFAHIYGIDLVHTGDGRYVILEDNLRIPSGIAYQMKCLELCERFFPELASQYSVRPFDIRATYLDLFRSLCDLPDPSCVILTDSKYGSAFFEHRYLSDLLDIPLVEGHDLSIASDGTVTALTIDGPMPVDLVYRRVEDLDMFVPGLAAAYQKGKVVLINAMGTGAGDDKLVFTWVPDMIRHYLGEEPILEQAHSYRLDDPGSRRYVLENLSTMVLKTRQGYGGIGVFVMPDLGDIYRRQVTQQILEHPDAFIAQDTIDFSTHYVLDPAQGTWEERFIDLRVYSIQNARGDVTVFPGGLTRVSTQGTRITNNSSGGLCKPTWVLT